MSNPYAKFAPVDLGGDQPAPDQPAPDQPAPDQPEPTEEFAGSADQMTPMDPSNPYANPEMALAGPLDEEHFQKEFYKRLNDPAKELPDIVKWGHEQGRTFDDKSLRENYKEARRARAAGENGRYGSVKEKWADEPDPSAGILGVDDMAAFMRGMNLGAFDWADEGVAAARAVPELFKQDGDFGKVYNDNWLNFKAEDELDSELNPGARLMGQIAGGVAGGAVPVGNMAKGSLLVRSLKGAGAGAVAGGLTAAGASEPGNRLEDVPAAVAIGTGIGAALPGGVEVAKKIIRPIAERVARVIPTRGGSNASANALSRRLNIDPGTMRNKADEIRDLGGQPTLFDTLDEAGQDIVGAAGRNLGGRKGMQEFADSRVRSLPDRIRQQARRLSSDTRTPDEVTAGVSEFRNSEVESGMLRIGGTPVEISPRNMEILGTPEGIMAIRAARNLEKDPTTRAALEKLPKVMKELSKLDPRLPQSARTQITEQLMEGTGLNVNMADKISRSLNDAATNAQPGRARVLRDFARTIRDDTKRQAPEYDKLMRNYGEASEGVNAVDLGETFLERNTDEFVAKADPLSNEVAAGNRTLRPAREASGTLSSPADYPVGGTDELFDDIYRSVNNIEPFQGSYTEAEYDDVIRELKTRLRDYEGDREYEELLEEAIRRKEFEPWKSSVSEPVSKEYRPTPAEDVNVPHGSFVGRHIEYKLPNGQRLNGFLKWNKGEHAANIDVAGSANWDELSNKFGSSTMRDVAQEIGNLYPELKTVSGVRVTGASRGPASSEYPGFASDFGEDAEEIVGIKQRVPVGRLSRPGLSDREAARLGGRRAVERKAGENTRGAYAVADSLANSSEQRARTTALMGDEAAADEFGRAMGMEANMTRDATLRSPRAGSRTTINAADGGEDMGAMVNVLYNPTSPISWAREGIRFMQRIGMTDADAKWIVDNVTDPALTDQMIDMLTQRIKDPERARQYVEMLRGGAVRLSTNKE